MTTPATPAPKQEAPEEEVPSGLLAREPALAVSYTTGLVIWLLSFLSLHGIITSIQASVLTQAVAPVVAGLIVAACGHLIRRYVSPALQASIVADVLRVEHEFTPQQLLAIRGMVLSAVEPLVLRVEVALGVNKPASSNPATAKVTIPATVTVTPAPKKAVKAPAKKAAAKK